LLIETGKPKKTFVEVAGPRTFQKITANQQAGIEKKKKKKKPTMFLICCAVTKKRVTCSVREIHNVRRLNAS